MNKLISLATIAFQLFTSFIGLFIIYLIFALLDMNDFDVPSGIGFLIFQPAFGIIISGLTIIACIIVGLPIRLIPRLYNWWSRKPLIVFVGVFIGLILLLLSLNSHFTEIAKINVEDIEQTKEIPNSFLVSTGWLLTAFCLLHFYPVSIIKWLKKKYGQKLQLKRKLLSVKENSPAANKSIANSGAGRWSNRRHFAIWLWLRLDVN